MQGDFLTHTDQCHRSVTPDFGRFTHTELSSWNWKKTSECLGFLPAGLHCNPNLTQLNLSSASAEFSITRSPPPAGSDACVTPF